MTSWIDKCHQLIVESIQCFPIAIVDIVADYAGEQVMIILHLQKDGIANSVFLSEKSQWLVILNSFRHLYRIMPAQVVDSFWSGIEDYYAASFDKVLEEAKIITDAAQIEQFRTLPYVLATGDEYYMGAVAAPFTKMTCGINREYYNQGFLVYNPEIKEKKGDTAWPRQRAKDVLDLFHKLYREYKGPRLAERQVISGGIFPLRSDGEDGFQLPRYYGFYVSYDRLLSHFVCNDYKHYEHPLYRIKILLSFLDPQDSNPVVREIFRESHELQNGGWLDFLFSEDTSDWIKLHGGNIEACIPGVKKCVNPECNIITYSRLCKECCKWTHLLNEYDKEEAAKKGLLYGQ